MTLLLKATQIDIAFAMTLWILRHGTSGREYRRRMTSRVEAEKTPNQRPRHQSFSGLSRESCANRYLCNNKANLLTSLETCCQKILCTRPKMTGARDDSSLPPSTFSLLFFNKNSITFNTLFLLGCVKITTVIFTHSEQTSENAYKSAKKLVIIKSYCKNR